MYPLLPRPYSHFTYIEPISINFPPLLPYLGLVHAGLPLSGPGPARPQKVVGGDPGAEEGHLEADLRLAPPVRAQEVEADEGRHARLGPNSIHNILA